MPLASDYSYSELMQLQNQAMQRVEEMQRRASRTAERARQEFSPPPPQAAPAGNYPGPIPVFSPQPVQAAPPPEQRAHITPLPVDYLHKQPVSQPRGQPPAMQQAQSGTQPRPAAQQPIPNSRQHNSTAQQHNAAPQQTAGNRQADMHTPDTAHHESKPGAAAHHAGTPPIREEFHAPPHRHEPGHDTAPHQGQETKAHGILNLDSDKILLLGLLLLLSSESADSTMLLALFYIMM